MCLDEVIENFGEISNLDNSNVSIEFFYIFKLFFVWTEYKNDSLLNHDGNF
jgi:hypothetical protein